MLLRLSLAARQGAAWRKRAKPARMTGDALSKPVHILRSEQIKSPMVMGLFRPVILVPQDFGLDVSDPKTRAVLEHEIAHVVRGDLWVNLAQRLVLALLWWCAPLYWVNAQIGIEREKLCDDIAVAKAGKGSALARALVDLAEAHIKTPAPLLAIGIHPKAGLLAERVQRLCSPKNIPVISKKLLLTSSLAVPLTIAALTTLTPRALAHNPHTEVTTYISSVTPLQRALYASAERGNYEQVKKYLEADVDPNFVLHGDGTPLFVAVRKGDMRMIKLLIKEGADVNLAAPGDGNPLIQAAMRGHMDIAKLLIAKGADVNAIVPGDETPLINAAQQGRLDMVRYLIANGADISLGAWAQHHKDGSREWRTPLGEAKKHGHQDVVKLLTSSGAQYETRTGDAATIKIVEGRVTSRYGKYRKINGKKHRGIDITNKPGTPIYAPADGQISVFNEFSFRENYGPVEKYGKTLELKSAGGVTTLFAHLQGFAAEQGAEVKAGDLIAYMGNTGFSTGPHVHIETHVDGKRVDPEHVWPSLK